MVVASFEKGQELITKDQIDFLIIDGRKVDMKKFRSFKNTRIGILRINSDPM